MSSKNSQTKAAAILAKQGWEEGKGLGRNEQGDTSHVRVQQKDGTLGIGYNAQVAQVWSQQSVAFADVLQKFGSGGGAQQNKDDDSSDDEEEKKRLSELPKKTASAGKHSVLYNKRRQLKTEGLNSDTGKGEILASASSGRRRQREEEEADVASNSEDNDDDGYKSKKELKAEKARKKSGKEPEQILPMTLRSPLLRRMCERCGTHEPKKRGEDDAVVTTKIPDPKPPKCTATPFRYRKEE